jgi:hypothetical protein
MTEQKPSVGRVVHYVSHGTPVRADGSQAFTQECRAAIVTAVRDEASESGDCVSLAVLNPTGMFFQEHICQDELPPQGKIVAGERTLHKGGTWHWPERV